MPRCGTCTTAVDGARARAAGNRRPIPQLWAERLARRIPLEELSRKASERLVRAVLGESVDVATVDRVVARAGGNAFYLEGLIRAVAENRTVLPESVLAMANPGSTDLRRSAAGPASREFIRQVFWLGAVADCSATGKTSLR